MPVVEDYSLTGPNNAAAVAAGLADGEWLLPSVAPDTMRSLQRRTNARAAIDTTVWLALIGGFGWLVYATWWSWWTVPVTLVYGALVGGASDSRWHECGHGTAFRSRLANEVVYYFASFNLLRGPTVWRWSHVRHHTDTIIVGRDYEIAFQRGMGVWRALYAFTGIPGTLALSGQLVRHSLGRIDADVATFTPAGEHRRVIWESRAFLTVLAVVIVASIGLGSPLPAVLVGLPTLYGAWLVVFFGITQHAGMQENVLDHRRNTRTVYMNRVFRFLYSNMNYHVEHHMFPSVPYHALPRLHAEVRGDLAPALPNTVAAYREVFSLLSAQASNPDYELPLDLPTTTDVEPGHIEVGIKHWMRIDDGAYDLGPSENVDVGALVPVRLDGRELVLGRVDARTFCLADRYCTHQRVSLAGGSIVDGQIECPKHNGRFDAATGEACRTPARAPLRVYRIDSIDGQLRTTLAPIHDDEPSPTSKESSE